MTSNKTIAFVSDAIYPYNKGGKETRLYEITTRLAARGYDVHIYCMKWWQGSANRVENGVQLHGICPYVPLYSGSRRSIKQGIVFGLACLRLLWATFDMADVDHMPFFPIYSMRLVCWLKGKKMIGTWHEVWGMDYWRAYLGKVKGTIAGMVEAISIKLPDVIVSVSPLTSSRLKDRLGYTGELLTVPNGINLEVIEASTPSTLTSDVLYAGRLLKHKNVDVLIEAIGLIRQQYPDIQAIIAGEGPEKENLIALVEKLSLTENITFLPFQENIKDLYGLMKGSKVFVLPSTREGFGLVVLEANACGIPVITVDHPDNAAKELVREGNGRIINISSEILSNTLLDLLPKPEMDTKFFLKTHYSWNGAINSLTESILN